MTQRKTTTRKKPQPKKKPQQIKKPTADVTPVVTEQNEQETTNRFEFAIAENLLRAKHAQVSDEVTHPAFVEKRPDGFDYVKEGYMRAKLNEHYPVWSWKPGGDNAVQFLGGEWVVVHGILEIYDSGVKRQFWSPGAHRIAFKRGKEHSAENVIDVDKNIGAANANAFKRAVNRLCNISDDIYRKQFKDPTLSKEQILHLLSIADKTEDEKLWNEIANRVDSRRIHKGNVDETISFLMRKIENNANNKSKESK